jgi:hypothetical protein
MACSSLWRAEWTIFRGAIIWQIYQCGKFVNGDDFPGLSQCFQVSLGGLQSCFFGVHCIFVISLVLFSADLFLIDCIPHLYPASMVVGMP